MASSSANNCGETSPATSTQKPLPGAGSGSLPAEEIPGSSGEIPGSKKWPRDARLIHILLANLGVHSYQERVPLQLMDFAYRYTSSVLSDAVQFTANKYGASSGAAGGSWARSGPPGFLTDDGAITLTSLRLAIASHMSTQFQTPPSKEWWLLIAAKKNKQALPRIERAYGLRLPPEKYCLTGVGWGLKCEWDSEEDVDMNVPLTSAGENLAGGEVAGSENLDKKRPNSAATSLNEGGASEAQPIDSKEEEHLDADEDSSMIDV